MTTQEMTFTFNEFKEEDGGWYDRRLLFRDLQLTFSVLQKRDELTQQQVMEVMSKNMTTQAKIEAIVFERCNEPEQLRAYLNTLPHSKLWPFIMETATKIGVFNPVNPN